MMDDTIYIIRNVNFACIQGVISTQFVCMQLTLTHQLLSLLYTDGFSLVSATAFLILVETELYSHAPCTLTSRATVHITPHLQASSCSASALIPCFLSQMSSQTDWA